MLGASTFLEALHIGGLIGNDTSWLVWPGRMLGSSVYGLKELARCGQLLAGRGCNISELSIMKCVKYKPSWIKRSQKKKVLLVFHYGSIVVVVILTGPPLESHREASSAFSSCFLKDIDRLEEVIPGQTEKTLVKPETAEPGADGQTE